MAASPAILEHATTLGAPPTFVELPVLRFSVEQYHQMIAAGVFQEDQRVELLQGAIVSMTPIGPPHRGTVTALQMLLSNLVVGIDWHVCSQQPITLRESELEPDLSIVRGTPRDYFRRHPAPNELALVIEVADSSLAFDRGPKAKLYAAAGVSEYWIVNLIDRQVEVLSDPQPALGGQPSAYASQRVYLAADRVPVALLGQPVGEIIVADILP